MPNRNPFHEENTTQEIRGEETINLRTQKIIRIQDQDGNVQDIPVEIIDSRPDQNGSYIDSRVDSVLVDRAGNAFPRDPGAIVAFSHSGLCIDARDKMANCTSRLHGTRSATIYVGQDGRLLPGGGAICSRCDTVLRTICVVAGILAIGVVLGIWRGAGLF